MKKYLKPAFVVIIASAIFFYNCSLLFGQNYPTFEYNRSLFIGIDYKFNNEFLYKPYQVREIPATKEIAILDIGNICIYVFSNEGKFIRRISRPGQGPGEILNPKYFDVDYNGDIYVYEEGNARISIFSNKGNYINSFRIKRNLKPNLYVNQKKEIVVNSPVRGYFITVYSRGGKVLREIGEIPKNTSIYFIDALSNAGIAFSDENENYYIILESLFLIKIFNASGKLIREEKINNIIPDYKERKVSDNSTPVRQIFREIIYRNNKIYVLCLGNILEGEIDNKYLPIFVLNKELIIESKILLPFEMEQKMYLSLGYTTMNGFEVSSISGNIIFPLSGGSEVLSFIPIN